jgi:hypothetical protein
MTVQFKQNGFVPQGHARIIPIRVIHAWLHKETGTWLSIQSIGPAMAVVWRASDSWAATPYLVGEVCNSLDAGDNFNVACELAKFHLSEGPPVELVAGAKRSAEGREKKAREAANARWSQGRERRPDH